MKRARFQKKLPKVKVIRYEGSRKRTIFVRRQFQPLVGQPVLNPDLGQRRGNTVEPEASTSTAGGTNSSYALKKQKLLEAWESIRVNLLNVRVEEMAPASTTCCLCGVNQDCGIIRCQECGPSAYYCEECCVKVHDHIIFHRPKKWNGNQLVYVPIIQSPLLQRKDGHDCGMLYTTNIFAVDGEGKQHQCTVELCRCEAAALTFLRYSLWPATPTNPKIGFSLKFMELLSVLQLECHLPAKTFCQALNCMRTYSLDLVAEERDIYRAVVGDSLTEYNYHRSSLNTRHQIVDKTIGRECPICEKEPPLVSMDGNFGLVHKVSSGLGHGQHGSRHGDLFFKDHATIKEFISKYSSDRKNKTNECSNFQAGSVVRSKNKNSKLDITGVFGCVCKHDIPLIFLDLFHGERLGYPVYALNHLLRDRNEELIVMYDIACSLQRHLEKNKNAEILQMCSFAVPVFHSFAHNTSCQLQYGQRYTDGTGLTDGEGIERLWSYLRSFKKITKEMSINNRQDLLSEALLHHTDRVIWNLASRLKERLTKAERTITENETVLFEILGGLNESSDAVDVWYRNWKLSSRKKGTQGDISTAELFVESLETIHEKRLKLTEAVCETEKMSLAKEIEKQEKESNKLRLKSGQPQLISIDTEPGHSLLLSAKAKRKHSSLAKLKSHATERQYLSTLMKKYADGQGVGLRVSKSFTINSGKMKKELDIFNSYTAEKVDIKDVSSPTLPIFHELETTTLTNLQQKAVVTHFHLLHAKDEITHIQKEALAFLLYLSSQSQAILNLIESTIEVADRHSLGKRMYFMNQHLYIEHLWDLCRPLADRFQIDLQIQNIVYETISKSLRKDDDSSPDTLNAILAEIDAFEDQIRMDVTDDSDESEEELEDISEILELIDP